MHSILLLREYGIVHLVQKIQDLSKYAAKTINLVNSENEISNKESFNREIISYSKTDNPAVVAIFGFSPQDFEGQLNPTLFLIT